MHWFFVDDGVGFRLLSVINCVIVRVNKCEPWVRSDCDMCRYRFNYHVDYKRRFKKIEVHKLNDNLRFVVKRIDRGITKIFVSIGTYDALNVDFKNCN